LGIKKERIDEKFDCFVIERVSEDDRQSIFNLKDDCKQYFNVRNWAVFYSKSGVKEPWLSIAKRILDRSGYHTYPARGDCDGTNVRYCFVMNKEK